MKHTDRRKALGKMFLDVSKYLLTVALISSLIADKLTMIYGIIIFIIPILSALIGFYVIPEVKEEE